MKTFASSAIAVAALTTICSVGASANPLTDSDNDGVFDEEPDHCPNTPGDRLNNGCPLNAEVVIVTGRPLNGGAGWIVCPDGTLSAHWNTCPTYSAGWGTFHVAHFATPGTFSHTETLADEDGDGVLDKDDKCRETDGDADFGGCDANTYCLEIDTAYELQCFHWAVADLSPNELGTYFSYLRDFAEGGCGGDRSHWACIGVYRAENELALQLWTVWDAFKHHFRDFFTQGLVPPSCPAGYAPQSIGPTVPLEGGYGAGFVYWSGLCVNICQDALLRAGLITSGAGATSAAGTKAGRVVLSSLGVPVSVGSLACDGPYLIEGE